MSSRARFTFCATALSLFLAIGGSAYASNANKNVKGNGGGNSNQNTTYVDPNGVTSTTVPTSTDVVAISATDQTVTLVDPVTTWGGVEFSNGSLKGNKKLTLSLTGSTWTGGVIDGSTLSTPDITIGSGSEKKLQGGGKLEVLAAGTATWTGDDIIAGAGTTISNSGTFKATSNGKISQVVGDTLGTFANDGTFEKSTAGTTTEIQAVFNSTNSANGGSKINVTGGSLKLKGGGQSSGTVTLANNTVLEIAGADFAFTGGTLNATGSGEIDVTSNVATFSGTTGSANLNISGTGTAKVNGSHTTTGRLKLSAGKLDATNTTDTTSVGGFDWSGGDIAKGQVTVTSSNTTISGTGAKNIYGAANLNLTTSTTWSEGNISADGGAAINNSGTFTINATGNTAITKGSGGGTFKNGGNLVKDSISTGTTEIGATFDNTTTGASVTVNAGTLKLTGGGSSNKGVSLASGAKLEIGANYSFTGGSLSSSGTGAIEVNTSGVTASFSGTSGSANLNVSAGTVSFDGSHTSTGTLSLTGGVVAGAGTAEVGGVNWSGGSLNGKVKSTNSASISGDPKTIGSSGELTLAGTSNTISAALTNQGRFTKDSAGTTELTAKFDSTGTLNATTGTLKLSGGGKSSNAVNVGANAKLELAGTYAVENATVATDATGLVEITGAGSFNNVSGNGAKVKASGTGLDFNSTKSTLGSLNLAAGTLTSSNTGSAEIGALDWNGGSVNGKVKSTGSLSITNGSKTIGSSGELTLGGTSNTITVDLTNQGKFTKDSSGTTELTAKFDSTGTLNATSGTLKLSGGGKSSNAVNVGANAKLELAGTYAVENATVATDSTGLVEITGAGSFNNVSGNGAKVKASGTGIDFNSTKSTLGSLNLAAGTLTSSNTGSAEIGALDWNGGSINGKVKSTGSLSITNGGKTIGTSGELTLAGASNTIAVDLTNQGNFTKEGSADAELTAKFDSTGALNANGGKLKLSGGGKSSNAINVGANSTLELAGTGYTLENTTLTVDSTGLVDVTGGATFTNVTGTNAKVKASNGTLDFKGSTGSKLGSLTLNGGSLTTSDNGSAEITGLTWTDGGVNGKVKSTGSASITGGAKTIGSGGDLTLAGTTNTISADLTNQGTFSKEGSAAAELTAKFVSTGILNTNGGKLKLSGGGTSSNAVNVGANSTLELAGAGYTLENSTLTVDATGLVDVTGGATFTNVTGTNAKVKGTNGALDFKGAAASKLGSLSLTGGSITSSDSIGSAEITNLDWTGGSVNGKVKNTTSASISGTAKTIGSLGELTLAGTSNTITADLTNNGKFNKEGATDLELTAKFDSTNTLNANGGKLKLSGGGKSSNAVNVGAGATLELGGTYTLENAALAVDTTGLLDITGATTFTNVNGSNAKVRASSGSIDFKGASATKLGTLALNGGSLTSADGQGSAEVNSLTWAGGDVNGKVKNTGGASISGSAKTIGVNGDLTLSGATNTISADLTNQGKFTKDGTNDLELSVKFDSTGTLNASNGKLKLSGGGKSSNAVNVGAGATLELGGTGYTFENTTLSVDATGLVDVTGGATFTNVNGSGKVKASNGTLNFNGANASKLGSLTLSGGSLTSSDNGSAEVGTLEWNGGNLNAKVKTNGNASITNGNSKNISGGDLTFGGTTTWDGASITTGNGAKLKNDTNGIFNANDGTLSDDGTGTRGKFTNAGQFKKNSGTGTTDISTDFDNSGTVEVTTGTLKLSNVIKNLAKGKIDVGSNGTLELNGNVELAATSELKGNGHAKVTGGTLLANTLIDILNFDFEGGSLGGTNTFSGAVNWKGGDWNVVTGNDTTTIAAGAILNLTKANGHDFNGRSIHNLGIVNWNGGNLRAGNGAVFTNDNMFNDLNDSARSIESPGKSGGFGGTFSFTNNGTYKKSNGGTTTIEIDFINNSKIEIASGAVIFAGTFTNNGSINLKAGASAKFTTSEAAPLKFTKDTPLSGTGTIDAAFVQAEGLVSPGNSPGTLTLTGSLTLLNTSQLLIELSGKTQGTDYDFLNVGGTAALSGNLSLSLLNGFGPTILPTDTFTILTATNGLSGVFDNVANGGRLNVGVGVGSFQVNYGTNSLTLSDFSPIPEPSTWALMGLGAIGVLFQAWRRRRAS